MELNETTFSKGEKSFSSPSRNLRSKQKLINQVVEQSLKDQDDGKKGDKRDKSAGQQPS
jgi:hypothetical protein